MADSKDTTREVKAKFTFDVSRATQQTLDSFRKMGEFFETAKRKAGEFEKGVDKVADKADRANKRLGDWETTLRNSTSTMEALADGTSKFGSKIYQAARGVDALLNPLEQAQRTYIASMGKFDATSREYLLTQNKIEAANVRIGASMTKASLPAMEAMARIAEKVANFIDKHPQLTQAAATVAAVAAVATTANMVVRESATMIGGFIDAGKLLTGMSNTILGKIGPAFKGLGSAGSELLSGLAANRAPVVSATADTGAVVAKRLAELAGGGAAAAAPLVAGGTAGGAALAAGGTAGGAAVATGAGVGAVELEAGAGVAAGELTAGAAAAASESAAATAAIPAALAVAVGAAALAAGVAIGEGILAFIDKATGSKYVEQANTAGKQTLAIAAYGAGWLTDQIGITQNAAQDWFVATSGATHATDAQTQALLENSAALQKSSEISLTDNKDFGRAADEYRSYLIDLELMDEQHRADELKAAERLGTQIIDAEAQYDKERLKAVADFAKQSAKEEQSFYTQRYKDAQQHNKDLAREDKERARQKAKALKEFAESESKAEADYNKNRLKEAEKWGEAALKREADWQRQQLRAKEDHEERVLDLAGQRDALGIVREMRAYEKERRRAEEDHNRETADNNAQHAQDLKDQAEAFAEQREERLKDFDKRNRDEQEEFNYRRKQANDDWKERRAEQLDEYRRQKTDRAYEFSQQQAERRREQDDRLAQMRKEAAKAAAENDKAYDDQKKRREKQLIQQLAQLDSYSFLMEKVTKVTYEGAAKEFTAFVTGLKNQIKGGAGYTSNYTTVSQQPGFTGSWTSTAPGGSSELSGSQVHHQAAGGYAGFGTYMRGEAGEEFVLNNIATRAAEQVLGAKLSQERLLGALAGGGGRGGGMVVTITNQFPGGAISATARRELVDQSVEASLSAFEGVVRQLSGQFA